MLALMGQSWRGMLLSLRACGQKNIGVCVTLHEDGDASTVVKGGCWAHKYAWEALSRLHTLMYLRWALLCQGT